MPSRFRGAGELLYAYLAEAPPFATRRPVRGARRAGVLYEAKVHQEFERRFSGLFVPGPWFKIRAKGDEKPRWCQADGLLFDFGRGQITVVEIKLQHTADAYHQLYTLYLPVVKKLFGEHLWSYAAVEVVKWFDGTIAYPCSYRLCSDVGAFTGEVLGVHIWKP